MSFPKHKCLCGTFRQAGDKWVCLNRAKGLLKCLRCGWKWTSRQKYVDCLPMHKEKSFTGLTDEHILGRLMDGTLMVLPEEARVFSFTRLGWVESRIREHTAPSGGTYRFVTVVKDGKKKDIALHRLVWMAANKRLVPEGCDIDHRFPGDDRIQNLRLLPSLVNQSRTEIPW